MKNIKKQNTKPRYEVISYGGKYQVEPSLDLYEVEDFMGKEKVGLAISLNYKVYLHLWKMEVR